MDFNLAKKIMMKNLCMNEDDFNEFKEVVRNMLFNFIVLLCEPITNNNIDYASILMIDL